MENKITLVLIRHPETEGNVVTNSEMSKLERPNHLFRPTEKGMVQIDRAITTYAELGLNMPIFVMHSTALRTKVLASRLGAIYGIVGRPLVEDSRLNEKWDGIFHSLTTEEISARYPEQIDLREKQGWYHHKPFGGESGPDVEVRIRSLLQELGSVPTHLGKTIVLCSHGNWQFLFEKIALGQSASLTEIARETRPIPNCAISVYEFFPQNPFEQQVKLTHINRYAPWLAENEPVRYV